METESNRSEIDKIVLCVFDESDEQLYTSMAAQYFPRSKDVPPIQAASNNTACDHSLPLGKGPAAAVGNLSFTSWEQDSSGTFATDPADPCISAAMNSRVALFDGDVTTLPTSVLVYTTNKSYADRSAISQYNEQRASTDYHQERKQVLTKPGIFGEVRCTSGGALASKYLYHVAGQEYIASQAQRCRSKLCDIYTQCLVQAAAQGDVRTICFTPLLVDVFGFPPALACEVAVTSVIEW